MNLLTLSLVAAALAAPVQPVLEAPPQPQSGAEAPSLPQGQDAPDKPNCSNTSPLVPVAAVPTDGYLRPTVQPHVRRCRLMIMT
jgi:hypothetical protein